MLALICNINTDNNYKKLPMENYKEISHVIRMASWMYYPSWLGKMEPRKKEVIVLKCLTLSSTDGSAHKLQRELCLYLKRGILSLHYLDKPASKHL